MRNSKNHSARFSTSDLMLSTLFVSMVLAVTFNQSGWIFLICVCGTIALICHFCVTRQIGPELCGAAIGFAFPALLIWHALIGELFSPPESGVYREIEMNIPAAAIFIFVFGSFGTACGAALGSLIGSLFAIINED